MKFGILWRLEVGLHLLRGLQRRQETFPLIQLSQDKNLRQCNHKYLELHYFGDYIA